MTSKKQKVTCDFRGYGETIVSACEKYYDAIENLWKHYWRKQQEGRSGTMTDEEAISVIENEIQIDVRLCTDEQVERFQTALYKAIAALRNQPTGEPLTLEQLRTIEKPTPVWWGTLGVWCLARKGNIIAPSGRIHDIMELSGQFYAYPPAHIDREAWEPCATCSNEYHQKIKAIVERYHGMITETKELKVHYCPKCGRPLTEKAWDELETRLRGVKRQKIGNGEDRRRNKRGQGQGV